MIKPKKSTFSSAVSFAMPCNPSNSMNTNNNDPFREISSIQNLTSVFNPNSPVPLSRPVSKNVTVEVSESRFCIIPSLFRHIEGLHWKQNRETPRLNANPDVFEMILKYFMFFSLPDYSTLTHHKATELLDLIKPLDPDAVKPLVQYVEHYIVTNPETTSSFFRKRFPSLSSLSSRNRSSTLHHPKSTTLDNKKGFLSSQIESQKNNLVPAVSPHIETPENQTQPTPPCPVVYDEPPFHTTKPPLLFPMTLVRSDSSSSDGSISKLSQQSSYIAGLPGQDENCMSQPFEVLGQQQQHPSIIDAYTRNNTDILQSSYPQRAEQFEFTGTLSTTTLTSATTSNNGIETAGMQREETQILGESNKQPSISNIHAKKYVSSNKKLFHMVFQSNKGDRGQRKMTHADWCSSEYVL
jgi:hypothetical protein